MCHVGRVDALTRTHVRLQSVTADGRSLGYEVRTLADILRVDWHDPYMDRIRALTEAVGDVFGQVQRPAGAAPDLVRDVVGTAREARQFVTLYLQGSEDDVTGLVIATTDLQVTVKAVDRFGGSLGDVAVPWCDIDAVDYGTEEEQIRRFLSSRRGGLQRNGQD